MIKRFKQTQHSQILKEILMEIYQMGTYCKEEILSIQEELIALVIFKLKAKKIK